MAPFILVVSVFVLGTGLVLGAFMLMTKLPGYFAQKRLDTRLLEITTPDAPEGDEAGELLKDRHVGPLPGLDRLVGGSARGIRARPLDRAVGRPDQRQRAVAGVARPAAWRCGFLAAAALQDAARLGRSAAPLGAALPWMFLRIKRTRRMRAFEENVPRGARPGVARAEGRPRVRDRHEDGRRRDARADRSRVPEDLRRAELRPAAEGRAHQPDASACRCSTSGSSRPPC